MNFPTHNFAQFPPGMVRFMCLAWVLIAVKCVLVWWAMMHWHVPFHPLWILAPTVAFAALATMLWATHRAD